MARSVKQETGRVPRCPGDAGGAPDAWPGTATNGSWRNRARPAGRRPPRAWRPRPAAGSTSRRARPTTRDARAAPQQIDVGARTGRETGVEIVRNLPGPLHGDRRRQEGVHAAHPGLHAPVQRRVQVHDLHGAVHAGVGATRADGGHRARHAAEAGQRGLQRVLHGLAVRLRLPTLPGRAVVGQPQCDSGHRSGLGSARAARFIRRRLVQVEADGLELAVQRGRVQRRLGVSVGFLVVIATARAGGAAPRR